MIDNERISKWRGECRHDTSPPEGIQHFCLLCNEFHKGATLYDSDPSAWTSELYQKIESNPIAGIFIKELEDEVMVDVPFPRESVSMPWLFLKSFPEQKASALAKAIQENS